MTPEKIADNIVDREIWLASWRMNVRKKNFAKALGNWAKWKSMGYKSYDDYLKSKEGEDGRLCKI